MAKLIIIEGLIGVGKSTLCSQIEEKLGYKVMYEPVTENPYLEKYYRDPKRWGLEMQFWLMSQRFALHQTAIQHIWQTGQSVCMDRSIYGDAVFCELNYLDGNIDREGYQSYLHMREVMTRFLMIPQLTLYLDASIETCQKRIQTRDRTCEQTIPTNYLLGLGKLYEKLLVELEQKGSKVIRLNWENFSNLADVLQNIPELANQPFSGYPKVQGPLIQQF